MNTFKVGDRVKVYSGKSYCSMRCSGQYRTVIKLGVNYQYCLLSCNHTRGVWNDEIKKIEPVANDYEWLDRIKENFKDGV